MWHHYCLKLCFCSSNNVQALEREITNLPPTLAQRLPVNHFSFDPLPSIPNVLRCHNCMSFLCVFSLLLFVCCPVCYLWSLCFSFCPPQPLVADGLPPWAWFCWSYFSTLLPNACSFLVSVIFLAYTVKYLEMITVVIRWNISNKTQEQLSDSTVTGKWGGFQQQPTVEIKYLKVSSNIF